MNWWDPPRPCPHGANILTGKRDPSLDVNIRGPLQSLDGPEARTQGRLDRVPEDPAGRPQSHGEAISGQVLLGKQVGSSPRPFPALDSPHPAFEGHSDLRTSWYQLLQQTAPTPTSSESL